MYPWSLRDWAVAGTNDVARFARFARKSGFALTTSTTVAARHESPGLMAEPGRRISLSGIYPTAISSRTRVSIRIGWSEKDGPLNQRHSPLTTGPKKDACLSSLHSINECW